MDTLDLFNRRLTDPSVGAQYTLDDDVDKLDDNYSLYIAKKKGGPKDDFPGKSILSIIFIKNKFLLNDLIISLCFFN